MVKLTKAQRAALCAVFHRSVHVEHKCKAYRAFRRSVQPGPGCVMVPFAGMWLGIEPDGYTHS